LCSRYAADAQFDDSASSITLFGLRDDVVSVERLVQSKYVAPVCYDKLDLHLPGIVVIMGNNIIVLYLNGSKLFQTVTTLV